jgi:hypothetical protein
MPLDTKVLVKKRMEQGSEIATLKNMTRSGLLFEGYGDYQPGMPLTVIFPYDPTKPAMQFPQSAEVLRVEEIQGSIKKSVAVKLSEMRLK